METVATSLTAAIRTLAPHQEYLLQGSILDSHLEVLLHRLRGLCDNADATPETFHDHEMVYQLKNNLSTQQSQYILFRVRQSIECPDAPCHIRYLGQAEVGDKNRHTLVRACYDVACSSNVRDFLNELGFKLDHEYVARGYFFHKGRMKVTISKIYRLLQPGKPDTPEPMTQSHLVELSVVAPLGQDSIGDDMRNFAEQLKPLVVLEKFDHRRLQ
ncbi:mediator of RNA polymerase II transcription subunit 18-like [Pomacea canaliculata]|uniref:mediator of RNA polymerase II transcription subunit 18-like n=1 Tax=Pomacea canaliculata TaxID=400727 RepID=UPI000D73DBD1|nr:mediator of RNA polymerase II transcription subunit 18-like [Pomacea canaliculata]XP_025086297.1 mediator of RNA polymerase II transcription subunit 18-like [Pomacea canaliculata]XP_025086298.1 mediator of RNA polymerase II transcription subunit 18-like [Pomacea canaliculata]